MPGHDATEVLLPRPAGGVWEGTTGLIGDAIYTRRYLTG